MMNKRINFAIVAGAVVFSSPVLAQDASVLVAGTRVRLSSPRLDAPEQKGLIVSATRDSLEFRPDGSPITRSLAVAALTSIDVSGGSQTHRGRDALYGLVVGAGAGAILGAASYKKPDPECFILCETRRSDVMVGAVLGGFGGTLAGVIVGSLDKSERWIPLRRATATTSIVPIAGGVRVAFSRRF